MYKQKTPKEHGNVTPRKCAADRVARLQAILDITRASLARELKARRKMEKRISEHHAQWLALFESSLDGVVVADMQSRRFLDGNKAFAKLIGCAERETRTLRVEDIHPAESLPGVLKAYDQIVSRKTNWATDVPVKSRTGAVSYVDITGFTIPYGGKLCIAAIFRNVTERRKGEAALKRNTARLTLLTRRLIEVREEERRRLALALHDQFGQTLTVIGSVLDRLELGPRESIDHLLQTARTSVKDLISRVQNLSLDLRPAMLDHLGLVPALVYCTEQCASVSGMRVRLQHSDLDGRRFHPDIETAAYRIVQEALTNVIRHAHTKSATVRAWHNASSLFLLVQDKGRGFDLEHTTSSNLAFGLQCMQERATAAGGRLTIESHAGAGTRITAEFPSKAHSETPPRQYPPPNEQSLNNPGRRPRNRPGRTPPSPQGRA